jgi:hypothetical protein
MRLAEVTLRQVVVSLLLVVLVVLGGLGVWRVIQAGHQTEQAVEQVYTDHAACLNAVGRRYHVNPDAMYSISNPDALDAIADCHEAAADRISELGG